MISKYYPTNSKNRAQSTTELALLIPIFFFIMLTFVKLFDLNLSISNDHTDTHVNRLEKFEHGNGVIYDPIVGREIAAGEYDELVPGSGLLEFGDPANIATDLAAAVGGNYLLERLFSEIPFFDNSRIIPDALQAFSTSALNSYINSGFIEVDWEGATWDGATAGLSSQEASKFFQGPNSNTRSVQEFIGSGVQSSFTSFTASKGDEEALLDGFVNGLMSSDTFGSWVGQQKNEMGELEDRQGLNGIVMGAAGGAITSTATGTLQGELNFKQVAQGAAMGGLRSSAMAEVVTGSKYGGDARTSARYGAFNGAVSTLISGGSAKDAALSGATGAFYSQQVQGGLQERKFLRALSSVAFHSGLILAQGGSIASVGSGALAGGAGYVAGQASNQINQWTPSGFSQGVSVAQTMQAIASQPDSVSPEDIGNDPGMATYASRTAAILEQALTNSLMMRGTTSFWLPEEGI